MTAVLHIKNKDLQIFFVFLFCESQLDSHYSNFIQQISRETSCVFTHRQVCFSCTREGKP